MADHGNKPEKAVDVQLTELPSANTSEVGLSEARGTHVQALHRWPQEPETIQNEPKIEVALTLLDVALMVLPVVLIVKTSLCIYSWHKDKYNTGTFIAEASDMSQYLIRFNGWLVTLFTILFVSIISTLLRRYALWKAERGATVAELEQYQASVSLPSTLKAIWSLRAFTITSIGLLFLWGWYYAGSQAIQREYALVDSDAFRHINLTYLSSSAASALDSGAFDTYSQVAKTDIVSLFHLYSQNTPMSNPSSTYQFPNSDIAGYALPLAYDFNDEKTIPGHWMKVLDKDRLNWVKVSSIGNKIYIPKADDPAGSASDTGLWIDDQMVGKYKYNYSYVDIYCSQAVVSSDPAPNGSWPTFTTILNMTSSNNTLSDTAARTMDLWVRYDNYTTIQSVCNITETYVEYAIQCLANGCKTTGMRLQPGNLSPSVRTRFDNDQYASDFINTLLYACGKPSDYADTSILEQDMAVYLPDPQYITAATPYYQNQTLQQWLDEWAYGDIAAEILTRYFNTWFTASQRLIYDQKFSRELAKNASIAIAADDTNFATTRLHGALYEQHYAILWPWIAIDYTSCFVLLAAAIVSYWLRRKTLAPDIFGYVSSLTRDNPNFELPGGSTLAGMDRSMKLKYVKVKIGDLNGQAGVGRVGMTPLDAVHDQNLRDLEKNRQYV